MQSIYYKVLREVSKWQKKTIAQLIRELSDNDLKGNRVTMRYDIDIMVENGFQEPGSDQ